MDFVLNHDVFLTDLWAEDGLSTLASLNSLVALHEPNRIHAISATLVQLRLVDCLPTKSSRFSEPLAHLPTILVMEEIVALCQIIRPRILVPGDSLGLDAAPFYPEVCEIE